MSSNPSNVQKAPKKVSPLIYVTLIPLLVIGVLLIALYGSKLSVFNAPSEVKGQFQVTLVNSATGVVIENANFDLIYYENETYYLENQTQTTIFSPEIALLAFANVSGYYPQTITVEGSGSLSTIQNNTMALTPIPNGLEYKIIEANGIYGNYSSSALNNYTGELNFTIQLRSTNTYFGVASMLPNCTLDNESYSYTHDVKQTGCWLALDCSMSNVTLDGFEMPVYQNVPVNGGVYNVTMLPSIYNQLTATFTMNIDASGKAVSMIIYDGIIEKPFNLITVA